MARAFPQAAVDSTPLRMSYDEWQAWYGKEEHNRGEWVDGEVVAFVPPLIRHVRIVGLLYGLMMVYAKHRRLGEVFMAEAELWLPQSRAARLPDICFIANQHLDRLSTHRLDGYADLVVEVISTDSVTRDRCRKFEEYQTAGIPEYWIIDPRPRRQDVSLYLLDPNGRYRESLPGDQGRLHSRALTGFWLDPAWLWQDPMPDPLQLLRDIIDESGHTAQ